MSEFARIFNGSVVRYIADVDCNIESENAVQEWAEVAYNTPI